MEESLRIGLNRRKGDEGSTKGLTSQETSPSCDIGGYRLPFSRSSLFSGGSSGKYSHGLGHVVPPREYQISGEFQGWRITIE